MICHGMYVNVTHMYMIQVEIDCKLWIGGAEYVQIQDFKGLFIT